MSRIFSLRGDATPDAPDQRVVEEIEALLERARRGEISALAYATIDRSDTVGTAWVGGRRVNGLSAGIAQIFYRFHAMLMDGK